MAKKKATHQDKPPQNQEHVQQTPAMDDASEKLQSLKSLNSILLKETVERRQQVDSLLQSKGSLESELTRAEMDKEVLHAELTRLGDRTVQLELERNLVFVFVAVQMKQQAEVIEKERDGFRRDKAEIEKRLGGLEREMTQVLRDKSEIEKVKSEKESEIGLLKKKLSVLVVEIDNERDAMSLVSRERDAMRIELDAQTEETDGLRLKLIETEKREKEIREEVRKLKMEYNGVVKEKEERERRIESMMRDKDSIERTLVESNQVIEEMKREIEGIVREKKGIKEESNVQIMKNSELQNAVAVRNEMILSLQGEEERLCVCVADLEKRCFEGVEKQKQLLVEIDVLLEEQKGKEKRFESLIEEKGMIMKHLDESLKQLDDQKRKMEEIVREKVDMEEVKVKRECEIVELQKQVIDFKDAILKLEESCKVRIDKIKQLESEVSHYRDAFDQVTIERDEARKDFDGEKLNGMNLRAKIFELEKSLEETHKVVGEMRAENGNLIGEKKELESSCAKLRKEMASVENELSESRKEFDDMQAKVELADAKSELALNILRNTAALVCQSKDERSVMDDGVLVYEQKIGEEIKPYVAELESIKNAFKSRESKVEDMKLQIEFLQNSVAEAHKRKSFWTVVSSATTIFAAASVAYVARGR